MYIYMYMYMYMYMHTYMYRVVNMYTYMQIVGGVCIRSPVELDPVGSIAVASAYVGFRV